MLAVRSGNLKWIVCPSDRKLAKSDPLCEAVLKRFRETEECPLDWPDDWKADAAPLVRRESTIHRLSSSQSGRSICVKIVKRVSRGSQDAATLYAALRHYHAGSNWEIGYTVPEPYGCVPEHQAVIMEWVEGRTFGEILKMEQFSTRKRHANIRKAAGWLRWFHLQSEVRRASQANGRQLNGIRKVFEETADQNPAATVHDPELRCHLEVASRSAGALRDSEIDSAVLHGDFKPTNLIISHSGVVVGIDFMATKRGPVSHDICRFLSDLDFYRNLMGRSFALSPGSGSNDFDAFLSGYGGPAVGIARRAFVYQYFLTILSALVHQRKKFNRQAGHRIRLAVLRRIARQLSHEVSSAGSKPLAEPVRMAWCSRPRIPIEWAVAIWQSELVWSLL
jgi:aminoglycoside phosphotransferase (APT) family kinase protein